MGTSDEEIEEAVRERLDAPVAVRLRRLESGIIAYVEWTRRDALPTDTDRVRLAQTLTRKFGTDVGIVLSNDQVFTELEQAVKTTLLTKAPDTLQDVIIAGGIENRCDIWLLARTGKVIQPQSIEELRGVAVRYLKLLNFELSSICVLGENRPHVSRGALLGLIKVYQPITIGDLRNCCHKAGFLLPDVHNLGLKIDGMRREGLCRVGVHRSDALKNMVVLTAKGVAALSARAGRNTTDVARCLELGKRKWYVRRRSGGAGADHGV